MRLISRLRGRCFCAFCKSERKIYLKKHIDLTNVGGALLMSLAVSQAYWGTPDPRALVLFCVTLVILEVFVYMRWRSAIICNLCGFDPMTYKRSPEKAAEKVRAFYNEREEDPQFQLTRSPLVARQKQRRAQQRKALEYKALEAKIMARRSLPKASSSLAPTKSP